MLQLTVARGESEGFEMSRVSEILHGGAVEQSEIDRVREVVLFEGDDWAKRVIRFVCLLILAASIATFGLLSDSVATVIGAMIVAPLMLPIMGLAFSISIGDRKAILTSIGMALLGISLAILMGRLLSLPFVMLDPEANTQIMVRTAPKLVDLLAALATGLAGAFAIARSDVSDTLPGVAIAISLVPPLANVGILLGAGRPDLAKGSMLLFVTNYLAIVLMGALMFGIMGYPKAVLAGKSKGARLAALTAVLVLGVVILAPLSVSSLRAVVGNYTENQATDLTRAWVRGSGYEFDTVASDDKTVTVTVVGQGKVPPIDSLKKESTGKLAGKTLVVRVVPERVYRVRTK